MYVTVPVDRLTGALRTVASCQADQRSPQRVIPLYLSAHKGILTLYATDCVTSIKCVIDADVQVEGDVTVDSNLFTRWVNGLEQEYVSIMVEEKGADYDNRPIV